MHGRAWSPVWLHVATHPKGHPLSPVCLPARLLVPAGVLPRGLCLCPAGRDQPGGRVCHQPGRLQPQAGGAAAQSGVPPSLLCAADHRARRAGARANGMATTLSRTMCMPAGGCSLCACSRDAWPPSCPPWAPARPCLYRLPVAAARLYLPAPTRCPGGRSQGQLACDVRLRRALPPRPLPPGHHLVCRGGQRGGRSACGAGPRPSLAAARVHAGERRAKRRGAGLLGRSCGRSCGAAALPGPRPLCRPALPWRLPLLPTVLPWRRRRFWTAT